MSRYIFFKKKGHYWYFRSSKHWTRVNTVGWHSNGSQTTSFEWFVKRTLCTVFAKSTTTTTTTIRMICDDNTYRVYTVVQTLYDVNANAWSARCFVAYALGLQNDIFQYSDTRWKTDKYRAIRSENDIGFRFSCCFSLRVTGNYRENHRKTCRPKYRSDTDLLPENNACRRRSGTRRKSVFTKKNKKNKPHHCKINTFFASLV